MVHLAFGGWGHILWEGEGGNQRGPVAQQLKAEALQSRAFAGAWPRIPVRIKTYRRRRIGIIHVTDMTTEHPPLFSAIWGCDLEAFEFLLANGADVNARGFEYAALHRSCIPVF